MKTISVEEFKEHAKEFLLSDDFVVIERDGQTTGIYFPCTAKGMPIGVRKEIFARLTKEAAEELRAAGFTEEETLADFEKWRNEQHAARD